MCLEDVMLGLVDWKLIVFLSGEALKNTKLFFKKKLVAPLIGRKKRKKETNQGRKL